MVFHAGTAFFRFVAFDRWTDRQTEFSSLDCICIIPCSIVKIQRVTIYHYETKELAKKVQTRPLATVYCLSSGQNILCVEMVFCTVVLLLEFCEDEVALRTSDQRFARRTDRR